MRADRDDIRFEPEGRGGNYTMIIAAGAVLVLAILLYVGLSDSDAPGESAPAAVVRDSAVVAPPVVDTAQTPAPEQQSAAGTTTTTTSRENFDERQLAPPTSTVGAGAAPVNERANSERLVIDGRLLEELEEDAQVREDEPAPNQVRTPQ
ncbi:MAG: hypothetical protein ACO1PZ_01165 [Gammaproteobacteria bacterium]